jgi:ABC-type sugar transport system substrate-binding protein
MNRVFRIITVMVAALGLLVLGNVAYGQTGKKTVIGFSQVGAENEWRVAMSRIMKETFANEKDMEFLFSDAQGKQ